jgi:hypothetical protein
MAHYPSLPPPSLSAPSILANPEDLATEEGEEGEEEGSVLFHHKFGNVTPSSPPSVRFFEPGKFNQSRFID